MIEFEPNSVNTLFYYDANGNKISHTYTDGAAYADMINIRTAQLQAIAENMMAITSYRAALANVQTNVDAGRPHEAPPEKPLQKNVSDTGEVTYTPFNPPLPDLVYPTVTPSGPPVDKPAPDRIDDLITLVKRIAAKLGV